MRVIVITLTVLVAVALIGISTASWAQDSPVSPLPPPTPTLGPPLVAELTLECTGSPAREQTCIGHVIQDEGRALLVELITAYAVPFNQTTTITGAGLVEWSFSVKFSGVPCWRDGPYARFYLKAVDMVYEGKKGYVCDEIFLYHDDCVALPLVGRGLR